MGNIILAKHVLEALAKMSGNRVVTSTDAVFSCTNPFVVTKSSNIPGKAVTEIPGLVYGSINHPIKKLAVMMTMTESAIELAGATGVDAILAHHPIADACNTGGVLMSCYLDLYNIAAFELHEAFHGLHPGIAFLHGHKAFHVDIQYGGITGNVVYVGEALSEIKTIGDIIARLNLLMGKETEEKALQLDQELRGCNAIAETSVSASCHIMIGAPESPVGKILHIFPHTGFTEKHLESAVREHPGVTTVIASISHVKSDHPLISKAKELGLTFICGDSHALEIFENGIPLAMALGAYLPELEIVIFRERMSSIPLAAFGSEQIREYGSHISGTYLVNVH